AVLSFLHFFPAFSVPFPSIHRSDIFLPTRPVHFHMSQLYHRYVFRYNGSDSCILSGLSLLPASLNLAASSSSASHNNLSFHEAAFSVLSNLLPHEFLPG